MRNNSAVVGCACLALMMLAVRCTKFAYENPIDINGTNRDWLLLNPGALLDTINGGNGIADYFDDTKYQPKDSIPPVITILGGDTVRIPLGDPTNQFDSYLKQVRATDDGGGPVTQLEPRTDFNPYAVNLTTDPYTVIYTFQDTSNNKATATRYIFVYKPDEKDTTKPVITIGEATAYVQLGQPYIDQGVTAWDNIDGDITNKIVKSGTVTITTLGQYTLTYTVSDAAGNSASATRTVVVQEGPVGTDRIIPVITLNGADTIFLEEDVKIQDYMKTYKEPGYTATDNVDGNITSNVVVGTIQQFPGSGQLWYLTYDVKDAAGNAAATKKRFFKTTYNEILTAPVIDLEFPDSIIQLLLIGTGKAKWVEPGYTATDVVDGDLTGSVVVDSSNLVANLSKLGTYYVTYTVTNSSELTTTKTRTVQIVDNPYDVIKPVITLLGRNPDTVLVKSSATYKDPGCTAEDNRDGDVTANVTVSGTVNMNSIGKYTVSYSVKDKASNNASITRTVWVVRDTLTTDLLIRYAVPSEKPLPNMENKVYPNYEVDGDGPDLSKITKMNFSWSLVNKSLYNFQLNYSVEPWNKGFNNVSHTFDKPSPSMKLTGTQIAGLDGDYYVSVLGDEFFWVEQTGKFAIIWRE
ncbi:MAG: DUF5011 domain-containing protein [Chitinispirillaceae bacterium]|nr:DUF5011 domain-containing protein [Chitinispirillaceae bacterium]